MWFAQTYSMSNPNTCSYRVYVVDPDEAHWAQVISLPCVYPSGVAAPVAASTGDMRAELLSTPLLPIPTEFASIHKYSPRYELVGGANKYPM
jgi:hypothetical protein